MQISILYDYSLNSIYNKKKKKNTHNRKYQKPKLFLFFPRYLEIHGENKNKNFVNSQRLLPETTPEVDGRSKISVVKVVN